jgi:hypothetical protein
VVRVCVSLVTFLMFRFRRCLVFIIQVGHDIQCCLGGLHCGVQFIHSAFVITSRFHELLLLWIGLPAIKEISNKFFFNIDISLKIMVLFLKNKTEKV